MDKNCKKNEPIIDFTDIVIGEEEKIDATNIVTKVLADSASSMMLGYCDGYDDVLSELIDTIASDFTDKLINGEINTRMYLTACEIVRRIFSHTKAKSDIIAG